MPTLQSTARIVNKSGAQVQDPRGFFNREQARKYSFPRGNQTRYSLGRLADFIGCNVRDIYWAVEGFGTDKAIVGLTNGLQKSVDYVYLQPELIQLPDGSLAEKRFENVLLFNQKATFYNQLPLRMEKLGIIEARVEAANQSRKSGKPRYIVVDSDDDCTVEKTPPATLSSLAAVYRNGSEDKTAKEFTPEPETTEGKTKTPKVKKEKVMKSTNSNAVKKDGVKKSVVKKATKVAAKKDRKAVTLPTGKKMKLTIAAALAKAKKGASLYRASNGSPLGAYYLSEYKNKEKEIEFIVKDAAK